MEIRKSKVSLGEWLTVLRDNKGIDGKGVVVKVVKAGEVVDVHVSGSQIWGSGGYSAYSEFAGEAPEFVEGTGEYKSTQFTEDKFGKFLMQPNSVIYMTSGDSIGRNGRNFGRIAYVSK